MARTIRTTCKIGACEPFCGIELDVEDDAIVAVRPDRAHPITRGYACVKGMHVPDYVNDLERLLHLMKRDGGRRTRVAWSTAIAEIGARLRAIRSMHGPTAIATY